jgi:hypothetical protein
MTVQHAYDQLADSLVEGGIKKSNMFGMPVLKLGRRPVAGLDPDGILFKLKENSEQHKFALSLEGSHLFRPNMKNGKGPLMKQWVVVTPKHQAHFDNLISAAIDFVSAS